MRIRVADENTAAADLLPPNEPDGSGIGVNYVDAYIKALNVTLEDERSIVCKRRGLNIELAIGDRNGEALLRRIEYGPDPRDILRQALHAAAKEAGVSLTIEDGVIYLDE